MDRLVAGTRVRNPSNSCPISARSVVGLGWEAPRRWAHRSVRLRYRWGWGWVAVLGDTIAPVNVYRKGSSWFRAESLAGPIARYATPAGRRRKIDAIKIRARVKTRCQP